MPTTGNVAQPAVLSSWKEIAAYLGKGVRTVQRWEKDDRLPVRRIAGTSKIVAYREELDRWLRAQPAQHSTMFDVPLSGSCEQIHLNIEIGKELRRKNALLLESMHAAMHRLMDECTRASISTNAQVSDSGQPHSDSYLSSQTELIATEEMGSRRAS
jgi:excisionase family DNA binding protein